MINLLIIFLLILFYLLNAYLHVIKHSFNYYKNYFNGKTFKQQFKESLKKNFANTGTEMIDYLKKRPYYSPNPNPDLGHLNLFTDIIKNQMIFVRFSSYDNSWNYEGDEYKERFNNDEVNIIYRDGKHFFSPKEEN